MDCGVKKVFYNLMKYIYNSCSSLNKLVTTKVFPKFVLFLFIGINRGKPLYIVFDRIAVLYCEIILEGQINLFDWLHYHYYKNYSWTTNNYLLQFFSFIYLTNIQGYVKKKKYLIQIKDWVEFNHVYDFLCKLIRRMIQKFLIF